MVVSEIKLYEIFKVRFGEKEAETIVEGIRQEVKEEFENKKNIFSTKEDISRLETKISETKVYLIKWMVSLVIASLIAQVSIMIALIKLVH